ncbi:hypothetical protein MOMA_06361 [Moraxella macacae 0408225]|uniref:Uncharacterized protein n=1 Tax=Moraxella macacae 0408225 TaxID=1230338 RepID=L2F569_9GAMM|nr:hypothetical protein [Moraxella macacae]ELA08162.1 hypothetical protein MOMA_06361 [Moraxella macacae 0408225]
MATWIIIGTILFIIGGIMGLKPSAKETHLDNLRMAARKIGLMPKLVACPAWLTGKTGERGKGMIAQYGLILDGGKLPPCDFQVIDGEWRPMVDNFAPNFALDKQTVDFGNNITPTVQGLSCKANFICLYWHENGRMGNPLALENSEKDLIFLKNQLQTLANLVQNSQF